MKNSFNKIIAFIIIAIILPSCVGMVKVLQSDVSNLPSGIYDLDKNHASITWKVDHMGLSNYTARFTDFDMTLDLDTDDVTKSSITANINPLSIETDYQATKEKDFNKTLSESSKWFNGLKFPKITFKSNKIILTGENSATMLGDLTMLGVSQPIELNVVYNGSYKEHPLNKKPTIGFSATAKIARSKWGLSTYIPMISDNVEVLIESEFYKK